MDLGAIMVVFCVSSKFPGSFIFSRIKILRNKDAQTQREKIKVFIGR